MKTGHKKTRILIDYMLPLSLLFPLNKTEIRRESETYMVLPRRSVYVCMWRSLRERILGL